MPRLFLPAALLTLLLAARAEDPSGSPTAIEKAAEALAALSLPAKLDTLKGDREVNQRLRKACYWLHVSSDPEEVLRVDIADAPRGRMAKDNLRRNLKTLRGLGLPYRRKPGQTPPRQSAHGDSCP